MGTAIPKQFLELGGRPILCHTIQAFQQAIPGIRLILVLPPHQISYAHMVLQFFPEGLDITVVAGGESRFHSVRNGLDAIIDPSGIIMVHDGVRPLVSMDLIRRCREQALETGSAIPVIPVTDSIRMVEDVTSVPIDRSSLRIVQTPQAFRADILLSAFEQPYEARFTDEATVVEARGTTVSLISGARSNLKITTPEDLLIATAILAERG
jgi:2-C-methyl-D-erythritol 4-phosphate cytidylyltransferase